MSATMNLQCESSRATALNVLSNPSFESNFSRYYISGDQEEKRYNLSSMSNGLLLPSVCLFCKLMSSLTNPGMHDKTTPSKGITKILKRAFIVYNFDKLFSKTLGQPQSETYIKAKDLLEILTASRLELRGKYILSHIMRT